MYYEQDINRLIFTLISKLVMKSVFCRVFLKTACSMSIYNGNTWGCLMKAELFGAS